MQTIAINDPIVCQISRSVTHHCANTAKRIEIETLGDPRNARRGPDFPYGFDAAFAKLLWPLPVSLWMSSMLGKLMNLTRCCLCTPLSIEPSDMLVARPPCKSLDAGSHMAGYAVAARFECARWMSFCRSTRCRMPSEPLECRITCKYVNKLSLVYKPGRHLCYKYTSCTKKVHIFLFYCSFNRHWFLQNLAHSILKKCLPHLTVVAMLAWKKLC